MSEPQFLNRYRCDRCGHEWSDVWSCGCDDDCPECGARHMSPVESEEIEASAAIAIADKRSSDDGLREARLAELLERAESFIAGFEGDDTQEEPVDELLEAIREELAA